MVLLQACASSEIYQKLYTLVGKFFEDIQERPILIPRQL